MRLKVGHWRPHSERPKADIRLLNLGSRQWPTIRIHAMFAFRYKFWQTHISTHSTIVLEPSILGARLGLDWARLGGRRGPRYCSRNLNDLIDICEKVGDLVSP